MSTQHHGDRWFAYHHASSAEHTQQWKDRTSVGWYCLSLSRANTAADPCFAAVWIWPENRLPKQTETHVDFDDVVAHLDGIPNGTIPTIITVCGKNSEKPRFTVVSEAGTHAYLAKAALSHKELLSQCTMSRANGKVLRWAAAYPHGGEMRYTGIWVGDPTRVAWKCTCAMEVSAFQKEFDANALGWVRPSVLIPTLASPSDTSSRLFMAGWTDSLVHWSIAYANIDDVELAKLIEKHKAEGLLPIQIQSLGIGNDMRYTLLVGSPDDVIERGTLVFDGDPPPPPAPTTRYLGVSRKFQRHPNTYSASSAMTGTLDAAVKKDMEHTGHRAAALALAHKGELVFAAGYTFAEEGLYPQTSATDVFRVGSLSKPITAIAIHQLNEKSPSSDPLFEERVAPLLGLTFKDPEGKNIRVKHLLAHIGGIPKNAGQKYHKDKMEYDEDVAEAVNQRKLPVDTDMVFEFVTALAGFVTDPPGNAHRYSNTGYALLGDIVRARSGSLGDYTRKEIFERVGIRLDESSKAPRWATSERLDDQDGEVRYHDSSLNTTMTVASSSGNLVPRAYGAWNMARVRGAGGWVMSAPHYLRILSRFTVPGPNPLFTNSSTETAFKTKATLTNGTESKDTWGGLRVPRDGALRTFTKGGATPGARAKALFRSDGWSMVYLTNSDDGSDANDPSDDVVSFTEFEAWLDPSWNAIVTDPTAWSKVYVTL